MINRELDCEIKNWIEKNKNRIIENWIELARIPSIKSEARENAPFGENCAKALEFAAGLFKGEGISCALDKEGGYAVASFGSGDKTIGIFSHSDVVPVGDGWLFTEPFNPVIKDGSLIGRGVEDNKSGIIAALCLTEFFKDSSFKLKSKLQTFIGSDEECGMADMDAFLEKYSSPDISFVPDADFPCSVGEKGICHFMVESKNKFNQIISVKGGEAFNIVLDKVKLEIKYSEALYNELSKAADNNDSINLTESDGIITLAAMGVAKHASIPEGSVNAAVVAFGVLAECDSLCGEDKAILKSALNLLSCYYGGGFDIRHEDVNFGKLTCVNGIADASEDKLRLSFDVRYGDTFSSDTLEKNVDVKADENGFTVFGRDNSPGFSIDKDSKIPELLEGIYAEITTEKLKAVLMSGGTYARRLKNAFSIGTSVILKDRETPVLEMPDGHGGPHQCDERIDIEGFFEAVRILIHYVYESDKLI